MPTLRTPLRDHLSRLLRAGGRLLGPLFRSRLVQFLAIGGLIFALAPAQPLEREVRLTGQQLELLAAARARQLGVVSLSPAEREEVSARALEDEVLYREALRLGLDKDDGVVRQRLIQKLLFLAEELAGAGQPPDEAALRACYTRKAAALRRPPAIRLVHVFAGSPAALAPLRPQLLAWRPAADSQEAIPPFGESFPLSRSVQGSLPEVASQYGETFAAALPGVPVGTWSEPIQSKFGWHLVLPLAFSPERTATFDEARPELSLLCWTEGREAAVARLLERSLPRYRFFVDGHPVKPPQPERAGRVAARSEASGED